MLRRIRHGFVLLRSRIWKDETFLSRPRLNYSYHPYNRLLVRLPARCSPGFFRQGIQWSFNDDVWRLRKCLWRTDWRRCTVWCAETRDVNRSIVPNASGSMFMNVKCPMGYRISTAPFPALAFFKMACYNAGE